jgi:protein gp37
MAQTSIEWTDRTWNPIRGCSRVSEGCRHCYAESIAARFSHGVFKGFAERTPDGPRWTGEVVLMKDKLLEPLSWREPSRVFVNSMSDLFHEKLPDDSIDQVFAVMALTPQHTYQVLTKRPNRMLAYLTARYVRDGVSAFASEIAGDPAPDMVVRFWPLLNVWLGVSVEDQATADERIPLLLQTPAAVRFISAEPLLESVSIYGALTTYCASETCCCYLYGTAPGESENRHDKVFRWCGQQSRHLDWVIVGGESGPKARPFDVAWARSMVRQCESVSVPVFVKQLGSHVIDRNDAGFEGDTLRSWPMDTDVRENIHGFREEYQGAPVRVLLNSNKGVDLNEWPADLRIRQFPKGR